MHSVMSVLRGQGKQEGEVKGLATRPFVPFSKKRSFCGFPVTFVCISRKLTVSLFLFLNRIPLALHCSETQHKITRIRTLVMTQLAQFRRFQMLNSQILERIFESTEALKDGWPGGVQFKKGFRVESLRVKLSFRNRIHPGGESISGETPEHQSEHGGFIQHKKLKLMVPSIF